jgi:poly(hydroxyalkanoate) depolymerase family esterase
MLIDRGGWMNLVHELLERLRRAVLGTSPGQVAYGEYRGRPYRLFVPGNHDDGRLRPLLVMLHGCLQDPDDFAGGTQMDELAEHYDLFVLYPAQSRRSNRRRCWNWFERQHQQRNQGEPAELVGLIDMLAQTYAIDQGQVMVAGLSAGACMAVILGMAYPERFAAIGAVAGLEYRAATSALGAVAAMRQGGSPLGAIGAGHTDLPPLILLHGTADEVVNPAASERLAGQWVAGRALAIHEEDWMQLHDARPVQIFSYLDGEGRVAIRRYLVHGLGHAWPGGSAAGSFTDPLGPQVSLLLLHFWLDQPWRELAQIEP